MSKFVILTDSDIDCLGHAEKEVFRMPARVPDDYVDDRWLVDIYDSVFQVWKRDSRGGEVSIRRSDGRIAVNSVGIPLDNAGNARRLGLALLAAADRWDELFPVGEVDPEVLKRLNDEWRAKWTQHDEGDQ